MRRTKTHFLSTLAFAVMIACLHPSDSLCATENHNQYNITPYDRAFVFADTSFALLNLTISRVKALRETISEYQSRRDKGREKLLIAAPTRACMHDFNLCNRKADDECTIRGLTNLANRRYIITMGEFNCQIQRDLIALIKSLDLLEFSMRVLIKATTETYLTVEGIVNTHEVFNERALVDLGGLDTEMMTCKLKNILDAIMVTINAVRRSQSLFYRLNRSEGLVDWALERQRSNLRRFVFIRTAALAAPAWDIVNHVFSDQSGNLIDFKQGRWPDLLPAYKGALEKAEYLVKKQLRTNDDLRGVEDWQDTHAMVRVGTTGVRVLKEVSERQRRNSVAKAVELLDEFGEGSGTQLLWDELVRFRKQLRYSGIVPSKIDVIRVGEVEKLVDQLSRFRAFSVEQKDGEEKVRRMKEDLFKSLDKLADLSQEYFDC